MKKPSNTKTPCRICHINGTPYNRTYYIPYMNHCSYINLPICDDLATEINEVMENPTTNNLAFFRITKKNVLLEFKSIHFPRSFSIDIMHCMLQNITSMIFKIWNPLQESEARHMFKQNSSFKYIGLAMANSATEILSYLGHAPHRIDKNHRSFKAVE